MPKYSIWLHRLTYLYLLLPFIIFCLGWLRLSVGLVITAVMLWVLWRLWRPKSGDFDGNGFGQNKEILRSIISAIIITGLWVFLSGVGGYAFQNWDFHWRNAVFRDLITYKWPVIYVAPDRGPIKMLVYYVGYWLLSALAGKLLGWQAANAFLYLWTWLGVLLVVFHISQKFQASLFKTALLLIAFSGMDALGVIFFSHNFYPTLWPPIQHLEIWDGSLQYSSFTTQLFWVFNQSVPAWLCASMLVTLPAPQLQAEVRERSPQPKSLDKRCRDPSLRTVFQTDNLGESALIWALCFFFAPLASIGLLPYMLIEWLQKRRENIKDLLKDFRFDLLFASSIIILISYLFFSSNAAAQERGFQALPLSDVLVFFLLEGGILWLFLAPQFWRDPRWFVTGIILFIFPFIHIGSGSDFVMRVSIVPLLYLLVWSGESIFKSLGTRMMRIALLVCLCIGALTPLYEINRSVYRTFEYYFLLDDSQRNITAPKPATHLEQGVAPEAEHPGKLVADEIQTLAFMDDKLTRNFIANVRQSLYYRYLASH